MSSLQPDTRNVDRTTTAPFLLRLFWRQNRPLEAYEFSVAPPSDTTGISDYSSLLPATIRQQSVQIYTWPTCTLAELTGLLTSVLPPNLLPSPAVGTRLVYKLIFPDTRAEVREGGKGKWIDKPLGSVVIGGQDADINGDIDATNGDAVKENLEGDADKTLLDARFVIGDYVACTIYAPGPDGRIAAAPPPRPLREMYAGGRGPPPPRENGGGYGRGGGGGYRGGYGGRGGGGGGGGGFGAAPPFDDWRRGERLPPGGGDRGYGGGGGGGYGRGRGGRPY
ncbi:hypothetical protein LTR85_003866 [Meristemomyces frigidus]|nr:hypothetical protein LTR85_003866 [Meristemomyces frigidus]